MKQLFGNYLGLCINNNDPEKRGRVQVFIPHIMPLLFDDWNEVGEDIKMVCVGDNLPNSLPSEVIEKLMKILPWAESASPILGSCAPGNLAGGYYNPSPSSIPEGFLAGLTADLQDLISRAAGFNVGSVDWSESIGQCGVGTRGILGALTNNDYFKQGLSIGGDARAGSLSTGNRYLQNSNLFNNPIPVGSDYLNSPSLWQIGDTISGTKPGGAGHVQTYVGNGKWVSDHVQSGIYTNYGDLKLHRLNPAGAQAVSGRVSTGTDTTLSLNQGYERTSGSGSVASWNMFQDINAIETDTTDPLYGSFVRPEVEGADLNIDRIRQGLNVQTTREAQNATEVYAAAYQNLIQRGVSADQAKILASGIVGNVKQETGYNPNKTHDNNTGYGLLGWASREGDQRLNNLVQFAQQRGEAQGVSFTGRVNPQEIVRTGGISIKTQVDFLFAEFDGANGFFNRADSNNSRFYQGFISSSSPQNAALYLSNNVVRPSAQFANNDVRMATAAAAAAALGGIDPSTYEFSGLIPNEGLLNNPDPHGAAAVLNMNNMAAGIFTYPAAGAVLWVFFREGNPLYPVYFAANYGQQEWQSAYRYTRSSPPEDVAGYKPSPTPENPVTSYGGIWGNKTFALSWNDTTDPTNPLNDEKSFMIQSADGSNMFFNVGYHQILSKHDRRDQVDGDRWESTGGFKDEAVQGDKNELVLGDLFVKVGNISPPAVDAVTRIQQLIGDIMKPLAESTTSNNN